MLVVIVLMLSVLLAISVTLLARRVTSARRRERLRTRLLAERLLVEARIDALTAQTLRAMQQATRDHLAMRGRR